MVRTKVEEINLLRKWQIEAEQESGSYLAQLMTDELVQYVITAINLDQSPDIFATWCQDVRKIVEANERYAKALHEIENLKFSREKIIENMRSAEQMVVRRDEIIRGLPQAEDIEGAKREIERLREENVRLKARLFDALEV